MNSEMMFTTGDEPGASCVLKDDASDVRALSPSAEVASESQAPVGIALDEMALPGARVPCSCEADVVEAKRQDRDAGARVSEIAALRADKKFAEVSAEALTWLDTVAKDIRHGGVAHAMLSPDGVASRAAEMREHRSERASVSEGGLPSDEESTEMRQSQPMTEHPRSPRRQGVSSGEDVSAVANAAQSNSARDEVLARTRTERLPSTNPTSTNPPSTDGDTPRHDETRSSAVEVFPDEIAPSVGPSTETTNEEGAQSAEAMAAAPEIEILEIKGEPGTWRDMPIKALTQGLASRHLLVLYDGMQGLKWQMDRFLSEAGLISDLFARSRLIEHAATIQAMIVKTSKQILSVEKIASGQVIGQRDLDEASSPHEMVLYDGMRNLNEEVNRCLRYADLIRDPFVRFRAVEQVMTIQANILKTSEQILKVQEQTPREPIAAREAPELRSADREPRRRIRNRPRRAARLREDHRLRGAS
jgi:hypothetical protein